jgi:hypothetical protein
VGDGLDDAPGFVVDELARPMWVEAGTDTE